MSNIYSAAGLVGELQERIAELEAEKVETEDRIQTVARHIAAALTAGWEVVIRPSPSKEWSDAEDPAHHQTGC